MLRRLGVRAALVAATVAGLVSLPGPGAPARAATAPAVPSVGVTRTAVTVGGILSGDGSSTGADIGAQARFARADAHGGVAGRTVEYSGTETDSGDPRSTPPRSAGSPLRRSRSCPP